MLLDCYTVPCAVVLTYFILKTRYNVRHILGVVLCIGGLVVLVYSDLTNFNGGQNKLLGDILCISGSFLYAISNVGTEAFVARFDRKEYLSMLGIFAFIISTIQFLILERTEVTTLKWNWDIISLLIAFSCCLFLLYSVLPIVLVLGGSALCNLSLLTSDVYAILLSLFLFNFPLSTLYYVAYVIIVVGLLFYNVKNEPTSSPKDQFTILKEEDVVDQEPTPDFQDDEVIKN